jgi:hypothetical protein
LKRKADGTLEKEEGPPCSRTYLSPTQQPRARPRNQLVDRSYCKGANAIAALVTLASQTPISPSSVAGVPTLHRRCDRRRNATQCAGGHGRGGDSIFALLALLVDGSDSPSGATAKVCCPPACVGSTSVYPGSLTTYRVAQTRQPWARKRYSGALSQEPRLRSPVILRDSLETRRGQSAALAIAEKYLGTGRTISMSVAILTALRIDI